MRKNRLPFGIPWIPQGLSAALLMGTFVVGVGTGVTIDSAINTNPKARTPVGTDRSIAWPTPSLPLDSRLTHESPPTLSTNQDLASRDAIDKNAPNPKFCQRYGASALVLDHRIFVSFNPFSVFATQADVKPGCVLRAANVVQALQGRGLLTDEDVRKGCPFCCVD